MERLANLWPLTSSPCSQPYWGLSGLRATQHGNLCFQYIGTKSSSFPHIIRVAASLPSGFDGVGGDQVVRWKRMEKLLGIAVLLLLLNVCLLPGCWQSFYSHSKPFMLISHMDALDLKNSWAKRSEKKTQVFLFGENPKVHLWLSVGQTLSSSSSSSVETRSSQLFSGVTPVIQRGMGALAEMLLRRAKLECCWALAEKTPLKAPLPEEVVPRVLQSSGNRALCRVCRSNEHPAERSL